MIEDNDRPIDLSSLDPTLDRGRFDGVVGAIMQKASDELHRRRSRNNVIGEITRWYRPILTAAAAAVAVLAVSLARSPSQIVSDDSTGVAEAIGIPADWALWVRGEARPTAIELYSALAEPQ